MKKHIRLGIRHAQKIQHIGPCPVCRGTSRKLNGDWCDACGVTGRYDVYAKRKLQKE